MALALLLAGCAHKSLRAGSLSDIHRLAVVVRVTSESRVALGGQADEALATALKRQVKRFEVGSRLREAVLSRLPSTPPWSQALSEVEVATALESLLVDDKMQPVDLEALRARGADGVLQLDVTEWGLHSAQGKPGLYLRGEGRLTRIDGALLWGASIDHDDLADPAAEAADPIALRDGGFRDAIIGLLGRVGERLAGQLAPVN